MDRGMIETAVGLLLFLLLALAAVWATERLARQVDDYLEVLLTQEDASVHEVVEPDNDEILSR